MNNSISNKIQISISTREIQMEKYRSEKKQMNNSIYKYWVIIGTKDIQIEVIIGTKDIQIEAAYKLFPKIQRHIGSTKRVSINTGLTCGAVISIEFTVRLEIA